MKFFVLLLAGPITAFGVLLLGCDYANELFGVMCGHNILTSLVIFTLAAWFVFAMASALIQALRGRE